ncbi:hypothetical protein [Emticicia fontis]
MKHLETFEAAAAFLGINPNTLPGIEGLEEGDGKAIQSTYKLFILSKAAWKAEGKVIDWTNHNQYKYYPWFRMSGSASGFSFNDFFFVLSYSTVGSRLVYPSAEAAEFVGNKHLDLYRDFMHR